MLKTRIVLILGLVLILLFIQQNFTWVVGLYGIGEQTKLYACKANAIYLVKAKQRGEQLSFIYRLSSIASFKIPLWPFCQTIVSNDVLGEVILLQNLIDCDFTQVKILQKQDVNFFIDILIAAVCLVIILFRFIFAAKTNIEVELC